MSQQNNSFILEDGQRITKVLIRHGFIVDSIGFETIDQFGRRNTIWFSGSSSPTAIASEIPLGWNEHVTQIGGTYGRYLQGDITIATMMIYTNLNPSGYGPYGRAQGTTEIMPFYVPTTTDDGTIIGFFGSYGTYLSSLGVYKKHGPVGRTP